MLVKSFGVLMALQFAAACTPSVVVTKDNAEVVIAKKSPKTVTFAAQEATNLLSRVLGGAIPVVNAPTAGKVSIFIGSNEWSAAEGFDIAGLKQDGYFTRINDKGVFLVARDDPERDPRVFIKGGFHRRFERGSVNALYDFLERHADCRFFFGGELGNVVPRLGRIVLKPEDRRMEPVLPERCHSGITCLGDTTDVGVSVQEAYATMQLRQRWASRTTSCCHGQRLFKYGERFGKTHPEYFALGADGKRIISFGGSAHHRNNKFCYSSGIREEIYQDVKAYLTGQPASSRGLEKWGGNCQKGVQVDIMPEDGFKACQCDACKAVWKEGDANYATEMIWGLAAEIGNRLKKEGVPGCIGMLAYSPYGRIPDFQLPDNVRVMVADVGPWCTGDPVRFAEAVKHIRGWAEKTGRKTWLWTYPGKYYNRFQDLPQYAPRAHAKYYLALGRWMEGGYSCTKSDYYLFDAINLYVYSRLGWDAKLDVDAVLDDWHAHLFGAAAKPMAEVTRTLEDIWINKVVGIKPLETDIGPVQVPPSTGDLWLKIYSPAVVARIGKLFDQAAAKVSPASREGRCVALFRKALYDVLVKHATEISVENELKARAARSPRNLLVNGELDTLDGWSWQRDIDQTCVVDEANKACGKASIKISSSEGADRKRYHRADLSQYIELEPGATYRLSYFLKAENVKPYLANEGAGLCIWEPNNHIIKGPMPLLRDSCDWIHVVTEFKAVGGRTRIQYRVTGATGTLWIDGVLLEKTADPAPAK